MNYAWCQIWLEALSRMMVSRMHWLKKGKIWFNERDHGVRTSGGLFLTAQPTG